jgi:predicted Zn-dependent protease
MTAQGKKPSVRAYVTRALLAAATLAALTRGAQAGLDRSIERTMDRQARQAIEAQYRIVDDARLAGLVQRLGAAVAEKSGRKDVKFEFTILDTPEVNALALPAGRIYVTTGLLKFADSTDELACVLAHEAAHVAAKHSLSQFKKEFWTDVLLSVLRLPSGTAQVVNVAAGLQSLRYSRKDEAEADRLGARYAYAAGFDPRFLKHFMDRLAKNERVSTIASYLSTHPTPDRRSSRLEELPQLDIKNPETAATIAAGYEQRHMFNAAILRLRQAAAAAPDNARIHRMLAEAYYQVGDFRAAASEVETLRRLSPGETVQQPPAPGPCVEPIPADIQARVEAARKRVEQAIASLTPADELKRIAKEMESSEKALRKRRDSLSGDISSRSSRLSGASADQLRRGAAVVRQVGESLSAVTAVRQGTEVESDDARDVGRGLAQNLEAERDPCSQAALARSADEFVRQVEAAKSTRDQAAQAARQAVQAATSALNHVDQGLLDMGPTSPTWGPSSSTFAWQELEAAERDSAKAAESAAQARELQAQIDSGRTAVRLNVETAAVSPADMKHLEALVGSLMAVPPQEVAAARRREVGLGTALVALAKEAPAQPALAAKTAPPKPTKTSPTTLFVQIVARTVLLEVSAGRERGMGSGQQGVLP